MSDNDTSKAEKVAEHVLGWAEELEVSGDAALGGNAVENAREVLHKWIDSVTAVINTPGLGRVTLVHKNGQQSSISSFDLPMALAKPVKWEKTD